MWCVLWIRMRLTARIGRPKTSMLGPRSMSMEEGPSLYSMEQFIFPTSQINRCMYRNPQIPPQWPSLPKMRAGDTQMGHCVQKFVNFQRIWMIYNDAIYQYFKHQTSWNSQIFKLKTVKINYIAFIGSDFYVFLINWIGRFIVS